MNEWDLLLTKAHLLVEETIKVLHRTSRGQIRWLSFLPKLGTTSSQFSSTALLLTKSSSPRQPSVWSLRLFERDLTAHPLKSHNLYGAIGRLQHKILQGCIQYVKEEAPEDPKYVQAIGDFLKIVGAGELAK